MIMDRYREPGEDRSMTDEEYEEIIQYDNIFKVVLGCYLSGWWSENAVKQAVERGLITTDEYQTIIDAGKQSLRRIVTDDGKTTWQ